MPTLPEVLENITPRIIHFVLISEECTELPLVYYVAIKSAKLRNPDYTVLLHTNVLPTGILFELLEASIQLRIVDEPHAIFGREIMRVQHKVDVLRLQILIEHGGIYLDLDTICIQPFDGFLKNKVVMGRESESGLCNCVIISPAKSNFLKLWYNEYRNFHNDQWNEFSVFLPMKLAQTQPDIIEIEPRETFFWPSFDPESLKDLFVYSKNFPKAHIFHLWSSLARDYVSKINITNIFEHESTYNLAARQVIGSDRKQIEGEMLSEKILQATNTERTIFTEIYAKSQWGAGSGNGSHPASTFEYRNFLERFIHMNNVSSVIDIGCGDWQSTRFINFGASKYLGFELVEGLVESNRARFGSDQVEFRNMPDNPLELPQSDLLIMKDVLQHLTNEQIFFFRDFIFPRYKFCLITNSWKAINYDHNSNISAGMFRSLDLLVEPYSFKGGYVVETWNEWERIRTMLITGGC